MDGTAAQHSITHKPAKPMLRPAAILSALLLLPWPALAQDQPIPIYFLPLKGAEATPLNNAILEALSQLPLRLEASPIPQAVVISVPGKIEVTHKRVSGTFYSFTVAYSRDGHSLGESQQNCGGESLAECTDQIIQDVKSVAARR